MAEPKKQKWNHKGSLTTRRNNLITGIVRGIIFSTMIASILLGIFMWQDNSSNLFMSAFTCFVMLVITFVPSYINDKTRMIIPAFLETAIVIFTFLAMYLGEIFRYYDRFWWWDIMLHSSSGFMLGLVGFLLFYSLNRDNRIVFKLNNVCIILFAFCFAMTCGALWEVFEFTGDSFLGMNMQKSIYVTDINEMKQYVNRFGRMMDPGLVDTMKDLIVDAIGAGISVLGTYLFMRHFRREGKNIAVELDKMDVNPKQK